MKKIMFIVISMSLSSIASANSETKTFSATDESRVKACARAKEDSQRWTRIQMSPPYIVSGGSVWKPTSAKYSSCDCGKSDQNGKTDCSIDATVSN
jgi:hypothetical protein